jgi:hypothetical protein
LSRTTRRAAATITAATLLSLTLGQAAHASGRAPSPKTGKTKTGAHTSQQTPRLQFNEQGRFWLGRAKRTGDPTNSTTQNVYAEDPEELLNAAAQLVHERHIQPEARTNARGEAIQYYTVPMGRIIGNQELYADDGTLRQRFPSTTIGFARGTDGQVSGFDLRVGQRYHQDAPGYVDRANSHRESRPYLPGWGV